jgi:CRP-like cAMP-binding protein
MTGTKLPPAILAAIRKPRNTIKDLIFPPTKSRGGKTLTGVYKGQFYRIKVPEKSLRRRFDVPKLGLAPPTPAPFITETATKQLSQHNQQSSSSFKRSFFERAKEWWKNNWTVLVLNFGSLCTLTAFTRSDVLELRTFSAMGSISFIVYNFNLVPFRYLPIAWSSLFAAVNSIKIMQILHERKARVVLTEQQEIIFVDTFMPHGVTPKQFEMMWNKAKIVKRKKGEAITSAGKPNDLIYLVIEGSTRANILGRHLTVMSTVPTSKLKVGGDSGAWIGEMAFLEQLFEKEQSKVRAPTADTEPRKMQNAMYTVVATEDCVMLAWTHPDMEHLMSRSTDMRAAITRAMTAAIVGKVINFTVSRTTTTPTWSTWLDDWTHNAGAQVRVNNFVTPATDERDTLEEGSVEDTTPESPPPPHAAATA